MASVSQALFETSETVVAQLADRGIHAVSVGEFKTKDGVVIEVEGRNIGIRIRHPFEIQANVEDIVMVILMALEQTEDYRASRSIH